MNQLHVYSFRLLGLPATITYKMREIATFKICLRYIMRSLGIGRLRVPHVECDIGRVTLSVYQCCDIIGADTFQT